MAPEASDWEIVFQARSEMALYGNVTLSLMCRCVAEPMGVVSRYFNVSLPSPLFTETPSCRVFPPPESHAPPRVAVTSGLNEALWSDKLRRNEIVKKGPLAPSISTVDTMASELSATRGFRAKAYSNPLLSPSPSGSALNPLMALSAAVNHWLCQFENVTVPNRPMFPKSVLEAFQLFLSSPNAETLLRSKLRPPPAASGGQGATFA